MSEPLTVGDLFAGIGGLSLGFQRAGFAVAWQVDADRFARSVLRRHWPDVRHYSDIRGAIHDAPEPVDVVCGGDPCPCRSVGRGGRPSVHPDLSGYFLAMVGRVGPRWVVRENVPAPDAVDFAAALDALGYGVASVELDSRDFTRQRRRRQFLVGRFGADSAELRAALLDAPDAVVGGQAQGTETQDVLCLTAHPRRLVEEVAVAEPGRGLRSLSAEEREALQGFPRGWTAGLSWTRRCILLGNAVTVPVAEWLARRILIVEEAELCLT